MKRTFIAIDIPLLPPVAALLTNLKTKLARDKIKWVEADNLHLTLFFLGDTVEDKIPEIQTFLQDVFFTFPSFEMELSGLGIFSRQGKPQVVWIGIKKCAQLIEIKNTVDSKMVELGFQKDDRPFKPHLTLGRIKFVKDKMLLTEMVDRYKSKSLGKVTIDKIIFYESELTSAGPVYKPLEKVQLI